MKSPVHAFVNVWIHVDHVSASDRNSTGPMIVSSLSFSSQRLSKGIEISPFIEKLGIFTAYGMQRDLY